MKNKLFWIIFLIIFLATGYLSYPFVLGALARFLIVRDRLENADLIVVLGGDDNGERVKEGVSLYRKGYSKKFIMSGGSVAWNVNAAENMRKQATFMSVPDNSIIIEKESESTLENAKFSLPIAEKEGAKKVILVTSPMHSRRARRVFNKLFLSKGIKIISWPVKIEDSKFNPAKWWTRHEDTQAVIWEYVALTYYLLKGY
jgi:uncharacterized SAM-binding protein YcdF (DUF218 family)